LHEICDRHDFNYWRGCCEKDRRDADWRFYKAGAKKAGRNPLEQAAALVYYLAVRIGGRMCFYYADKQRDESDLLLIIEEYNKEI